MTRQADNLVREFHQRFDLPIYTSLRYPGQERTRLRARLIREEYLEVMEEFAALTSSRNLREAEVAMTRLAKELADLRYVIEGAALELGIPLSEVYHEVHRSNMSKLGREGRPLKREDGKILKGPHYFQPDVAGLLSYTIDVDSIEK